MAAAQVVPTGEADPGASRRSGVAAGTGASAQPGGSRGRGGTAKPAAPAAPTEPAAPSPAAKAPVSASKVAPEGAQAECGGPLTFGQSVTCPSISGAERHVYTVTSTTDSDKLYSRQTAGSGASITVELTDSDGERVCFLYNGTDGCQLGVAGAYTATVRLGSGQGSGGYTLAVESMRTPSSCTDLPNSFFSFASPGLTDTLPAGSPAKCYSLDQPPGSVLRLADTGAADVQGPILSGDFQPVCYVRDAYQCTLLGPGPYRLFLFQYSGLAAPYTLHLSRISHAAGCPLVPLASFGDPGTAIGGARVEPGQAACHLIDAADGTTVAVRIDQDQLLWWSVHDVAGKTICDKYSNPRSCKLQGDGPYLLLAENIDSFGSAIDYRVAAVALGQAAGCAEAVGTSWDLPALHVHQTSAVQINCQPFAGEAGDRVIAYLAPDRYNSPYVWLADEAGNAFCPDDYEQDGCVLPSTGTYRVVSYLKYWDDGESDDLTYRVQVKRLSRAAGCPTVTAGAYNADPAGTLGGIRCRILDIRTPGKYRVDVVDDENYRRGAQVYDGAGLRVCYVQWCEFNAPGRYTLVLSGRATNVVIDNDYLYAVALLHSAPSGCAPVSDAGYAETPYRGTFAAAGQYDCLQLASPAGAKIVELLPADATGAGRPTVTVADATGEFVCDSYGLRQGSCELTGTAPFFAVLQSAERYPTGTYAIGFARVDGPHDDCPTFGRDAAGATVQMSADHFAVCLSIPADQHAARETFTYRRTSGSGNATVSVFDSTGLRYCGPGSPSVDRTFTCSLPAGPLTVILEADAVPADYQLIRRDASASRS
ncbi:hypothetical protein AB0J86_03145 [Micromonospora sp. NPDC049559]|uniref:hypothetical protein n=1 Tax=Micromonospora sp. NPDC049559 TaxID=3155923 RepID=UPI00342F5C68